MLKTLIEMLLEERSHTPPLNRGKFSDPEYFRALCNIRPPVPVSKEFFALQDLYLGEETRKRGIEAVEDLNFQDQITLWQGDITKLDSDAIVNAGNADLLGCFQPLHNCIDNVIHSWAGVQVRVDCQEIMKGQQLPNGEVVVTPAYNLPSEYIFHTVGPIVRSNQPSKQDVVDLQNCYNNCLDQARNLKLKSVSFCCISTGVYGYPQDQAATLAVGIVRDWLKDNGGLQVIFNVFLDKDKIFYERELSG